MPPSLESLVVHKVMESFIFAWKYSATQRHSALWMKSENIPVSIRDSKELPTTMRPGPQGPSDASSSQNSNALDRNFLTVTPETAPSYIILISQPPPIAISRWSNNNYESRTYGNSKQVKVCKNFTPGNCRRQSYRFSPTMTLKRSKNTSESIRTALSWFHGDDFRDSMRSNYPPLFFLVVPSSIMHTAYIRTLLNGTPPLSARYLWICLSRSHRLPPVLPPRPVPRTIRSAHDRILLTTLDVGKKCVVAARYLTSFAALPA